MPSRLFTLLPTMVSFWTYANLNRTGFCKVRLLRLFIRNFEYYVGGLQDSGTLSIESDKTQMVRKLLN